MHACSKYCEAFSLSLSASSSLFYGGLHNVSSSRARWCVCNPVVLTDTIVGFIFIIHLFGPFPMDGREAYTRNPVFLCWFNQIKPWNAKNRRTLNQQPLELRPTLFFRSPKGDQPWFSTLDTRVLSRSRFCRSTIVPSTIRSPNVHRFLSNTHFRFIFKRYSFQFFFFFFFANVCYSNFIGILLSKFYWNFIVKIQMILVFYREKLYGTR